MTRGSQRAIVASFAALVACGTSDAPVAVDTSRERSEPTPDVVLEESFGRRLLAGPHPEVAEGTDDLPPRPLLLVDGARSFEPIVPSFDGRITAAGVVWATVEGTLIDGEGLVLASGIEPDLSVSPDGERVAYTAHRDDGSTAIQLLTVEDGTSRPLTETLSDATTPFFVDDERLVVVGARNGDVMGLWLIELGRGSLVPLTNAGLRVGEPFGPDFVPPPYHQRAMRVEEGTLIYDDGEAVQRVPLGSHRLGPIEPPARGGGEVSP